MKIIKTIIVDDERNAREEIKKLIRDYPEFEIVGEAKNADDAKEMIEQNEIDLIFLDIQMPEKSGFELLELLNHVPQVIFITAYDQYALKAFEVSAIDYLMKPVRVERFARAIDRFKSTDFGKGNERVFVKDGQRYHFIIWSKIYLIESMDNYARLYFDEKNVFLKSSLNQLEQKLDNTVFFRINRAQIVNLNFIKEVNSGEGGRLKLILNMGNSLEVSERQSVKLKKLLSN
ncbi:MAG TPA: response regulator transcription factor [Mucilaginibacter sp.]|nr:response regulator transcription factor [Mucilaginibacter sp.]